MKYNLNVVDINTYPPELIDAVKNKFYEKVEDILLSCNLICYHFTRLISDEEIKKNGIKKLKIDEFVHYVKNNINAKENIEGFINDVKNEIKNYNVRENRISFIAGLDERTFSEYEYYSTFFGGEFLEIISRKYPNINQCLREIGTPFIIKFIIPVNVIKFQSELYEKLINRIMDNINNEKKECIELYTYNYDVPNENILSIREIKKGFIQTYFA